MFARPIRHLHDIRGLDFLIGIECQEAIASIIQKLLQQRQLVITKRTYVIILASSLLIMKEEIDQAVNPIKFVLKNIENIKIIPDNFLVKAFIFNCVNQLFHKNTTSST